MFSGFVLVLLAYLLAFVISTLSRLLLAMSDVGHDFVTEEYLQYPSQQELCNRSVHLARTGPR